MSEAVKHYIDTEQDRADIIEGTKHQQAGRVAEAMTLFRGVLKRNPNSVNAMCHLATLYWQGQKRFEDAEALLRRATQLAPDSFAAWLTLGALFIDREKYLDAINAYENATALDPNSAEAWAGLGNANGRAKHPEKAVKAFTKSIAIDDSDPAVLSDLARELKTIGDQVGALKAYRQAIKTRPGFGPAYWSMTHLEIFNFEEEEIVDMLKQVERDDLTNDEDIHFRFALGKVLENNQDFDRAWHFYDTGNQRKRMTVDYEPLEFERRQTAIKSIFDAQLMTVRGGCGFDAPDPIFIVGLPCSGSTLVEQILTSHSQVEGTSELPILGRITEAIGHYRSNGIRFPEAVPYLRDEDLHAYGKQYFNESMCHRNTKKPRFTDKLPNNFPILGFAHLILPNAKFINARRHPFDSCLDSYKQLFGRGHSSTYDMLDLAHYYQQYDAMMKHWHEVLPGKVLDVHYEQTVTDLDGQVRKILDHCGLPFEENCLRSNETGPAVKTAGSEQVPRPTHTDAMGQWRRYEEHLDLWHDQLGYILDELPEATRNAGL